MTREQKIILRDAIIKGIELAHQKLIDQKKKEDAVLILYREGRILKVKAKDL